MRRAGRCGLLALLLVLTAGPAAAWGNVFLRTDGSVVFADEVGRANDVTITFTGTAYVAADAAGPLRPGAGCAVGPEAGTVSCPADGVTQVAVGTGAGDDRAQLVATSAATAQVDGGAGDDRLEGGPGRDLLFGGLGSDRLSGGGGDDQLDADGILVVASTANTLDGGEGDDVLVGGDGGDTVQGGPGADSAWGRGGTDTVAGGAGADTLAGGGGDDTVRGEAGDDQVGTLRGPGLLPVEQGADTLDGGQGDDVLRGGPEPRPGERPEADALVGGDGTDTATYAERVEPVRASLDDVANDGAPGEGDRVEGDVERLVGGTSDDALAGGPGADVLEGGRGDDRLAGLGGDDLLDGGTEDAGSDALEGGAGADRLLGNAGEDRLAGDDGRDEVQGGGGDDVVDGGDGDDLATGGPGRDAVRGGGGDDRVLGAADGLVGLDEADRLEGDAGDDRIAGGDGDDAMAGGAGVDVFTGGAGEDTADYGFAAADLVVSLDDRANDGVRGEGDDVRTDVENVSASGVDDTIAGSDAANRLRGGAGEDYLDGERGSDVLEGGVAVDVVRARDGTPDEVDCGPSTDLAIVDRVDAVRGCERTDTGDGRPRLGARVVVAPQAGAARFALPEASRTVPLEDRLALPLGTRVDANAGRVELVAGARDGQTQRLRVYDGAFAVGQRSGLTELRLVGGDFGACRATRARRGSSSRGRPVRSLWGRGRGRYRTRGRGSSATVRGTTWLTQDFCDGTLTRVVTGSVRVRDFARRRTVTVRAGDSYFARLAVRRPVRSR